MGVADLDWMSKLAMIGGDLLRHILNEKDEVKFNNCKELHNFLVKENGFELILATTNARDASLSNKPNSYHLMYRKGNLWVRFKNIGTKMRGPHLAVTLAPDASFENERGKVTKSGAWVRPLGLKGTFGRKDSMGRTLQANWRLQNRVLENSNLQESARSIDARYAEERGTDKQGSYFDKNDPYYVMNALDQSWADSCHFNFIPTFDGSDVRQIIFP